MSIMPSLKTHPKNTPTAAMAITVLKLAAFAPTAPLRKFTASLDTPTQRSKMASPNRKIIIPKKIQSINYSLGYEVEREILRS